jgi:hypothetical protein
VNRLDGKRARGNLSRCLEAVRSILSRIIWKKQIIKLKIYFLVKCRARPGSPRFLLVNMIRVKGMPNRRDYYKEDLDDKYY